MYLNFLLWLLTQAYVLLCSEDLWLNCSEGLWAEILFRLRWKEKGEKWHRCNNMNNQTADRIWRFLCQILWEEITFKISAYYCKRFTVSGGPLLIHMWPARFLHSCRTYTSRKVLPSFDFCGVYGVFFRLPLLTWDIQYPRTQYKTTEILYSPRLIYISTIIWSSSYLYYWSYHVYGRSSDFNLWWPQITFENNRGPHTKYVIKPSWTFLLRYHVLESKASHIYMYTHPLYT